jgi:hypothetical protein
VSESHPPISLRPKQPDPSEAEKIREGRVSTQRTSGRKRDTSGDGTPVETSSVEPQGERASGAPGPAPQGERASGAPGPLRASDPGRDSEPIELSADRRLDALRENAPPPSDETAPFLLARSSPGVTEAPAKASKTASSTGPGSHVRLLRMARRLGVLVLINALLFGSIALGGALRYAGDRAAIPEVVAAIIALGLTLWGTLAGYHLLRASRGKPNAGHQLAGAFSNLRSIFILKGTGLFLVLALSCFAFSAVLSLFALL